MVVVAATAILAKMFLFGKKKKKGPVTLKDPMVKYPLKLVDKEVLPISIHFFLETPVSFKPPFELQPTFCGYFSCNLLLIKM